MNAKPSNPSPRLDLRVSREMLDALRSRVGEGGSVGEYVRKVLAEHLGIEPPSLVAGIHKQSDKARRKVGKAGAKARWGEKPPAPKPAKKRKSQ